MKLKITALAILFACGFSANSLAQKIGDVPKDFTYTNEETNQESFVLSTDEWVAIQIFAAAARTLPITEEDMHNAFQLGSLDFGSNYKELLSSYQSVHDTSGQWLNAGGYRDQMVGLATDIVIYSDDVLTGSKNISSVVEKIWLAILKNDLALGDSYLTVTRILLEKMLTNTQEYYDKADDLSIKLTGFINILNKEYQDLKVVQSKNSDILQNDGSATKDEIDKLQDRVEEVNRKYSKWVKVATTSPVYSTVAVPFGLIASISTASVGTAKAIALKNEIKFIKEDIDNLTKRLKTEELTYASWQLANSSITNTRDQLSEALNALEKLKGAWVLVVAQLEAALEGIQEANSEDVISNPNLLTALTLTAQELGYLENRWEEIKDSTEDWVRNAYVTQSNE
ncbi:alpha-xenorhabdolysin family binary toxin subunit A [Vibrio sp. NH-UV-68]|uniref:alpha-xenorhabdolysin family binary toxin subunit A n=1 Tax=unclassified Vibrio TaxID=2614977 RepID=UPI0036F321A9